MRLPLRLLTTFSVVVGTVVVAAQHNQAAPSTARFDSASAEVAASAGATSALVAPAPALVPVEPTVRSYALTPVPGARADARASAERAGAPVIAARTAPEPADGFVVTGATWKGATPSGLELRVRTRSDGAWSDWTELTYDIEHGPDPGSAEAARARPGTDPFVAGDIDDIQLEASTPDGSVPADLTLDVVLPGASVAQPSAAPTPASLRMSKAAVTSPVGISTPTPRSTIYTRAQWGAAESMRDCCVEFGEIHAAFVHHTVNANNYTAAEVPAILRGIYAYHTQSRGWRDIGYNFLIDKFGRIWEGRYGGMTKPVVGAHTLNYNENAFAASAIGNFETTQPKAAMLDAYARLFAWKLSLSGVDPTTRQNVAGTTFNAISGHRDAASTACPGINLYRKIPQIIAKAAEYQNPFAGRGIYRTLTGDAAPDLLAVERATGRVSTATGTAPPEFGSPKVVRDDFASKDQVVVTGDVSGDGHVDVLARDSTSGQTRIYTGNGSGTFTPSATTTRRWAGTDLFAAPGDLTGDGRNDVVARDTATGSLLVYPGGTAGRFKAAQVAVASLAGVRVLAAAGDFDKDGSRDLLGRGAGGVLRVYFGDGTGAFPRTAALATGWQDMTSIAGGIDLTGDGRPDVVARNATTKTTRIYANIGGTRLSTPIGATTVPLGPASLSNDADGDRIPDLVSNVRGRLEFVPAYRQNFFGRLTGQNTTMADAKKVLVVGDWTRDGYVDTMSVEPGARHLWLYPGGPAGATAKKRIGGWTGLAGYSSVTGVGDFDGDGWPDLMARSSNGGIYLFRGRGDTGLRRPFLVRSGIPAGSKMLGVGRWNGDGAPDVAVKTRSGRLYVYPGNGPGGLDDPILIGTRMDRYNLIVYVGDATADRRPDLVGRDGSGDLFVLPKAGSRAGFGRIGPRLYAGSGFQGYRLG